MSFETTTDSNKLHQRAVLALASLAQFMVVLDVSVVNVALPSIHSALHFSEQDLQWVVNAYTVTFAGFLLLGGRAADLIGRRRVFVAGLVLFALASLAGGFAGTQPELIAARAAQGLGGAIVAPASLSILTTTFEEGAARNRAVGIWGAMGGAGGAAGVLLGGVLTDLLSWRWILFINVPIGLLAAIFAQRYIPETRDTARRRSFDLAGAITATVGLSVLVFGIVRTDVTGWGSASTLALLAAGVVLLGMFLAIEGRIARAPLMPLRIYSSRTLSAANVVVLLIGAAVFAMWFFLSLYLQQVLGYSPAAGRYRLPADDPVHRGLLDDRLARRDTRRTQADAGRGHDPPGGRPAPVHAYLARRQLPERRAGAFAADRDRDRVLVRPGHDRRRRRRRLGRGWTRLGVGQHLAVCRWGARAGDPGRARHRADERHRPPAGRPPMRR